ncbi:Alpha-hemolysin translocation ATP-binding protein HlyB [Stieleria maiorica]|uniref:Alpha-hemolysin translocation ATP-binding protein HlyB n=1 Tax=Stieleria maiorica TaxID=2795974 RepID=A0A5B9MH40_9BACT|nr:ATP-binding cassette domain-containing protein [Stieleria maiorica]QEF99819.1 Alpha-hemolysin translocation ATP-binding protein HlyB [Stieleria maiorica]
MSPPGESNAPQLEHPESDPRRSSSGRGNEAWRAESAARAPTVNVVEKTVAALVIALDVQPSKQPIAFTVLPHDPEDPFRPLIQAAENAGIVLRETPFRSAGEAFAAVQHGYALVFALRGGKMLVLEGPEGRRVTASIIGNSTEHYSLSKSELIERLGDVESVRMLVAKKELECETLSRSDTAAESDGNGSPPSPVQRFVALLDMDRRDLGLVVLFAGVAGVLGLATPLVVEGLVNVVSWGTYFQPLVVLAGMLLTCLGIAGVLKVLQTWVVEIIQRRQFVRIVSDLSHRFPRANQASLRGKYPREFANRVFDIMTIQKATAVLLLDGVTVILTTALGLFLLAFYHPFLLGFDLVLVFAMVFFTWLLGRNGIQTAIKESKTKYEVAHWLQDVIAMPSAFKTGGGERLAILRANQLTTEYIQARKKQFGVVIRQVIFAVGLQVVASTVLLGLGGWLVINGQLTLGQLVASELVVTVVVGAFAKAGKSLEKFYDMMAGIDKVGNLLDIPPDPRTEIGTIPDGPAQVSWSDLAFHSVTHRSRVPEADVAAGSRLAVIGDDQAGKDRFARSLAGLMDPNAGVIQVAGFDAMEAAIANPGELVGYAGEPELFYGSIVENVSLGRPNVSPNRVRQVLTAVDLLELVLSLPDGLNTKIQTGGYPLTREQQVRLVIARAIAPRPRLVVINGLLDEVSRQYRDLIWNNITGPEANRTLIVFTNRDEVADLCDGQISLHLS